MEALTAKAGKNALQIERDHHWATNDIETEPSTSTEKAPPREKG